MIREKLEADRRKVIAGGAKVKADSDKKFKRVLLSVPTQLLEKVDGIINDHYDMCSRTLWMLEAISKRVESEGR